MTWNSEKGKSKLEPLKIDKNQFFKKGEALVHDQGLKVLVWGDTEVGKTFFCMSAPEPIYAIGTEFGLAPLLRHFPDKEIYIHEAAILDDEKDEPDVDSSMKNIEKAIASLRDVEAGTIVIDSGTDIWQWLGAWVEQEAVKANKMTSAGTPQRLQWGRANLRWRQMILRLMSKPVHFIITAQSQEEYSSSGQQLGTFKPKIQRQTPHMCDVILHLRKTFPKVKGKPVAKYIATVTKCRFQRGLDMKIEDVTWDRLITELKDKLGVEVTGVAVR